MCSPDALNFATYPAEERHESLPTRIGIHPALPFFEGSIMPTASVLRRLVLVTALMGLMGLASTIESSQGKKKADAPQAGSSFEIYKDKGGKFRFRLRDSDDKLLANSGKGYKDNA